MGQEKEARSLDAVLADIDDRVKMGVPDVSWDDIRDIRILVDHIDHRIDHEALWTTLERDVPHLLEQLGRWREGG